MVARKRWGLGVRTTGPKVDLPVHDGWVSPLSGGMSVARQWQDLFAAFIPVNFGGTNTTEVMFGLPDEAIPVGLRPRRSGPRPGHYVLEPGRKMPIEDYEELLESTRPNWVSVIP